VSSILVSKLVANCTNLVTRIGVGVACGLTYVLPAIHAISRFGTGCGREGSVVLESELYATFHTVGGFTTGCEIVIVALSLDNVILFVTTNGTYSMEATVFGTSSTYNSFFKRVVCPKGLDFLVTANGTSELLRTIGHGRTIGVNDISRFAPSVINGGHFESTNCTNLRVLAGSLSAGGVFCKVTGGSATVSASGRCGTSSLRPNVCASVERNANNGLTALVPSTKTNSIGLASLYYECMRGFCKSGAIVFGSSTFNKLEVVEPVIAFNCPSEGYRTISGSSEYIVNHVHVVGLEGHRLGKCFPNEGILLGTIRLTGSRSFESNVNDKGV
jgi:hypothetical protein